MSIKKSKRGPSKPGLSAALLVILLLGAAPAAAQRVGGVEQPKGALQQPPPTPSKIPPLEFLEPLPTEPVAWIDDQVITQADLLRLTLKYNLNLVTQALAANKKLELELNWRGLKVDPKDVEDELKMMVEKMAPGKTLEQLDLVGANSLAMLRKQAWASRGWKLLYWEQFKIPADQRHADMNPLILQIVRRQIEPNFQMRVRGQVPGPRTRGAILEVTHIPSQKTIVVGANEALDFLMGLVKQSSLLDALDSIIDTILVDRELKRAGVEVTAAEVAAYSAAEDAKFAGTIIPRAAILRQQGMTVDQDNERWRRIQAWKRVTGASPSQEELMKFLDENRSFFMNEHKRVSHILVRTTDEVTGLPYPEEKQKELEKKARLIWRKAVEGVDFGMLARTYSDDSVTARGDGRMAAVIKPRGGGLDPAFQKAAWALQEIGDISEPVKSSFGWHIIKLEEYRKPAKSSPDFTKGSHAEWLRNEYETDRMKAWLEELRSKAKIRKVDAQEIFALKKRRYWSGKELILDQGSGSEEKKDK